MRVLLLVGFLGTLAACSDPKDSSGGSAGHGGSSGSGGSGGKGGAAASGGAGLSGTGGTSGSSGATGGASGTSSTVEQCNDLELIGPVTQWTSVAEAAPEALGGTVLDGIYALTHVTFYELAGVPDFSSGRTTVEIDGPSWRSVEDADADETGATGTLRSDSFEWSGSDGFFFLTQTCPEARPTLNAKYTADGDQLTLYMNDDGLVAGEVFERQ